MDYWAHAELGRPGYLNVTLEAQFMDPEVPVTVEYRVRHDLVIDDEPHMTNLGGDDIPMISGAITFNQTFEVEIDNGAGSYCVRIYLRLPDGDWIRPSQNYPGALSCVGVTESHWDNVPDVTEPEPTPQPEPEPEPEQQCVEGETRPAEDGCNDCVCGGGEWACTEMACLPTDDDSSTTSAGGMTTSQMVRIVLGVVTMIASIFLLTLLIRGRNQDDEEKFA